MPPLPSIFELCKPRQEVLAGQLPDSIFAADLWEVVLKKPEHIRTTWTRLASLPARTRPRTSSSW